MEESIVSPVVSALIVAHNNASDLARALRSLQQSTDRDTLEILVVDNGSRDATAEVAAEFPDVIFHRLPRNFGRTRALNIMSRTARGEYLCYLEPQMEVTPTTLAILRETIESDPSIGGVVPVTLDEQGNIVLRAHRQLDPAIAATWSSDQPLPAVPLDAGRASELEYVSNAALFVRREFVRGMHYFDEKYGNFGAEAELCYQLRQSGKKLVLCPGATITLHPVPRWWEEASSPRKALLSADYANGLAVYLSKRHGFGQRVKVQAGAALTALGRALTFRDPAYNLRRFSYVASGKRVDGNQGELL